jgi:hypothetical protein
MRGEHTRHNLFGLCTPPSRVQIKSRSNQVVFKQRTQKMVEVSVAPGVRRFDPKGGSHEKGFGRAGIDHPCRHR